MTPPTDKALATRERILEAADRLFHRHGYHATGLDRIVAEAGVTKGNFYYHFKSKDELAAASLERHFERMAQAITVRTAELGSPLETLENILDFFVEVIATQKREGNVIGCYFGNFGLELGSGHAAVRHRLQGIFNSFRGRFAFLIQRAIKAGELPPGGDAEQIAAIVVSLLEGAILIDKSTQEPREIQRAVDFLKRYLRNL